MSFHQITQLLACLLTGLVAGLFYAYQCSVIGGLGQLGDKAYLMAFQSINKAILNPWFFAGFMGCLLVLPLASWMAFRVEADASFYFLLMATLAYFIGVFGITVFGNVPLNDALGSFDIATGRGNFYAKGIVRGLVEPVQFDQGLGGRAGFFVVCFVVVQRRCPVFVAISPVKSRICPLQT